MNSGGGGATVFELGACYFESVGKTWIELLPRPKFNDQPKNVCTFYIAG